MIVWLTSHHDLVLHSLFVCGTLAIAYLLRPLYRGHPKLIRDAAVVSSIALSLGTLRSSEQIVLPEAVFRVFLILGFGSLLATIFATAFMAIDFIRRKTRSWVDFQGCSDRNAEDVRALLFLHFGGQAPSVSRIKEWRRKNPHAMTLMVRNYLDSSSRVLGVFKVLPLTEEGVRLIENGRRTGTNISEKHIAQASGTPAGIYVGDVVATEECGRRLMRRLEKTVRRYVEQQIPIFTRPLTPEGADLVRRHGFVPLDDTVDVGTIGCIHRFVGTGMRARDSGSPRS